MTSSITGRDFINGIAIAVLGAAALDLRARMPHTAPHRSIRPADAYTHVAVDEAHRAVAELSAGLRDGRR
ncbi:MAG: hypothetical protein NVS9B2_02800 [Steroidobacteraceae bacterium]